MRMKTGSVLLGVLWLALSGARTPAQDLGTHFTTVRDGIHVYAAKPIDFTQLIDMMAKYLIQ